MYKYTGKNLLSGRDYIWNILLDLISNKLWLGYGAGALPSHFFDTDLSSHNLYLQISLQVGILGLILLLIFLYFIWMKLRLSLNDKKTALVASYFVGIIIYQLFEITLTQNNFGLAIIQWLIIGLGLSLSFNKRQ
jgi:O-antigen ligase